MRAVPVADLNSILTTNDRASQTVVMVSETNTLRVVDEYAGILIKLLRGSHTT